MIAHLLAALPAIGAHLRRWGQFYAANAGAFVAACKLVTDLAAKDFNSAWADLGIILAAFGIATKPTAP